MSAGGGEVGSVVPEGAQPVAAVGRPHFNH